MLWRAAEAAADVKSPEKILHDGVVPMSLTWRGALLKATTSKVFRGKIGSERAEKKGIERDREREKDRGERER